MKKFLVIALLLVVGIMIFLATKTTDEPPKVVAQDSLRQLTSGQIVGFESGYDTHGWLGVPFAYPPVAEDRWGAPKPPIPWTGVQQALEPGAVCPQIGGPLGGVGSSQFGQVIGSEDCLMLHVWAPRFEPGSIPRNDEQLPVMVWIHGGGNSIGYGAYYDGSRLAGERNLVVVSINYRLGILGWFRHESLRSENAPSPADSGNLGTLDTIAALEWVQENIEAFGGDPNRVTIFGESAGGMNVFALLASPRAAGLFHRAISQSGATVTESVEAAELPLAEGGHPASSSELVRQWLVDAGEAETRDAATDLLNQWSRQQQAAFLRGLSPQQLLAPFAAANLGGMYTAPFLIRDGEVLPRQGIQKLFDESNLYNQVPVILGSNRDEMRLFMSQDPSMTNTTLGMFVRLKNPDEYFMKADLLSRNWKANAVDEPARSMRRVQGPTVFAYRFDWDETGANLFASMPDLMGAAHGLEIPFVFGDFSGFFGIPLIFTGDNVESRETLGQAMMSYWAEFAYNGDPGRGRNGNLPHWTPWDNSAPAADKMIILDSEAGGGIRMASDTVTYPRLRERIVQSDGWTDPADQCRVYAQVFWGSERWDQQQYLALNPSCSEVDPAANPFL